MLRLRYDTEEARAMASKISESMRDAAYRASAELARERDAVVQGFGDLYGKHAGEFPSEAREGEYRRRLESAYPIHPELFDHLFDRWSTLEKFQRTRGVLRLMAAVIHSLWREGDGAQIGRAHV